MRYCYSSGMEKLHADDGFGNLIPVHPVQLIDGRVVSSYSEEWRHECEARHILNLPTLQRRQDYLFGTPNEYRRMAGGILQRRGEAELKRLQDTMLVVWRARKAEERANRLGRESTPANDGNIHDEQRTAA